MAPITTLSERIEQLRELIARTTSDGERLDALSDLASLLSNYDPDEAYRTAREGLRLARQCGDRWHEGMALNAVGGAFTGRADFRRAIGYYRRAIRLFRKIGNELGIAASNYSLAMAYKEMGDYHTALDHAMLSHAVLTRERKTIAVGMLGNQIGLIHQKMAAYDKALEYLFPALETFRREGDHYWEAILLYGIGNVYLDIGDLPQAEEFHRVALEIRRRLGDGYGAACCSAAIGEILLCAGERREGLRHMEEAHAVLAVGPGNAIGLMIGIGWARALLGDLDEAIRHGEEALRNAERTGKRRYQAYALLLLGDAHQRRGDTAAATDHLRKGLAIAEEIEEPEIQCRAHRLLSSLHEEKGELAAALAHYKRYDAIEAGIDRGRQQRNITRLLLQIDHARSERLEEMLRLEREELRLEVERKKLELAAAATERCREHSLLQTVERSLRTVMEGDPETRQNIAPLLCRIRREIETDCSPDRLLDHFTQLYPDLPAALARSHPALTPTELRVCLLLRASLASKQIAEIIGVSLKSVEIYRVRIRRKLRISTDTNLTTFLARL